MKRTRLVFLPEDLPIEFHALCKGAALYDSSCSPEARVIFIDRDGGYFLKAAPKGSLEREASLGRYFYQKGLTGAVLDYLSLSRDWLLTARVPGEDATHPLYLGDPARLAVSMGELLRRLHDEDFTGCPVQDRTGEYFQTVRQNYERRQFDLSFGDFSTADEAFRVAMEGEPYFKRDTLLHGDFCLPNFLMENWRFTGFIDLGNGGVGDRHIDLFWGAWTLNYNLHTDRYRELFFEAYGKERVDRELLRAVAAAEVFG